MLYNNNRQRNDYPEQAITTLAINEENMLIKFYPSWTGKILVNVVTLTIKNIVL